MIHPMNSTMHPFNNRRPEIVISNLALNASTPATMPLPHTNQNWCAHCNAHITRGNASLTRVCQKILSSRLFVYLNLFFFQYKAKKELQETKIGQPPELYKSRRRHWRRHCGNTRPFLQYLIYNARTRRWWRIENCLVFFPTFLGFFVS